MKFGFNLAKFSRIGDPGARVVLTVDAKAAGWGCTCLREQVNWPTMSVHADP